MKFDVMTLFPEMVQNYFRYSILKRAVDANIIDINTINPRDYTENKHKKVDDIPYGGGAGMVLMPQPYVDAYESIEKTQNTITIMQDSCKIIPEIHLKDLHLKDNIYNNFRTLLAEAALITQTFTKPECFILGLILPWHERSSG